MLLARLMVICSLYYAFVCVQVCPIISAVPHKISGVTRDLPMLKQQAPHRLMITLPFMQTSR
jgi:hypothetical protein